MSSRTPYSWCQCRTKDGEQCLIHAVGLFAIKDDSVGLRLCRTHWLLARRKGWEPRRIR